MPSSTVAAAMPTVMLCARVSRRGRTAAGRSSRGRTPRPAATATASCSAPRCSAARPSIWRAPRDVHSGSVTGAPSVASGLSVGAFGASASPETHTTSHPRQRSTTSERRSSSATSASSVPGRLRLSTSVSPTRNRRSVAPPARCTHATCVPRGSRASVGRLWAATVSDTALRCASVASRTADSTTRWSAAVMSTRCSAVAARSAEGSGGSGTKS